MNMIEYNGLLYKIGEQQKIIEELQKSNESLQESKNQFETVKNVLNGRINFLTDALQEQIRENSSRKNLLEFRGKIYEALKKEINTIRSEMSKTQGVLTEKEKSIQLLIVEKEHLNEEVQNLTNEVKSFHNEIQTDRKKIKKITSDLKTAFDNLNKKEIELQKVLEDNKAKENELENLIESITSLKNINEKLNSEVQKGKSKLDELKFNFAKSESEIKKLSADNQIKNSKIQEIVSKVEDAQNSLMQKNSELTDMTKRTVQLEENNNILNINIQKSKIEFSRMQKQLEKNQKELEQRESENEKLISENERLKKILENERKKSSNEIFTNSGIHDILMNAIKDAKSELDIMSPWVASRILDLTRLTDKIRQLLEKGVKVKIAYGTDSDDPRAVATDYNVQELKRELQGYKNFRTKNISSHGKLFICDEKYYVLTSMNPLSNDGTLWEEIGEKSYNGKNLREYREKYFNF